MNNLRKLRISKNMQQKELAAILNIKISTYCQYETGKRQPDYETLKRIANYFNVSTDYLLGAEKTATISISGLSNNDIELIHTIISHLRNINNQSE